MAEDEAIFDPSLKKKKKKKKTPFDLDAALGGETTEAATAESEETQAKEEPAGEDISVDADLDFGGKKKKKKKPLDLGDLDDALPDGGGSSQDAGGDALLITDDDPFAFDNMKKKKKKRKEVNFTDQDLDLGQESKDEAALSSANSSKWANTDRDYTYDELVTRVFDIMREKNPEMVAGEKKRFVTKPPQVVKAGAKKTSFANFADICKLLHRQPKHLLNFLLTELGTSGSLDGMNQLIIKGRFQQKQIESVLRSYIKEYVTCHTCRSPDTILQKDTRLYFLQCETCGSRCSVASIKSGFQAVTGKRAAMRAKTTA